MLSRNKLIKIIVIVFILGFLFTAYRHFKKPAAPPAMPATVVELATVKTIPWGEEAITTGVVSAEQGIMIKAEVAGRVTKIFTHSGSVVASGDIILQINPEGLEQQLQHDKAAVILAKQQLDQITPTYKKGFSSRAEYNQAVSNYNQAQAQMQQTQQKFDLSQVRAPLPGSLGVCLVNEGDFVNLGQNLVSLQDMHALRVDFAVPSLYLDKLKTGLNMTARENDHTFTGKVYAVDSMINQSTDTILVRALLDDTHGKLLPGAFVSVKLILQAPAPAMVVPQTAIVYSTAGTTIFKVSNGTATEVPIKIGARRGHVVVILSGLAVGDTIVSVGKTKIHTGSSVTGNNP